MTTPQELIQAYFENNLNEGELDELRAWLDADPAHVDQFAAEAMIHSQLCEAIGDRKFRESHLASVLGDSKDTEAAASASNFSPASSPATSTATPAQDSRLRLRSVPAEERGEAASGQPRKPNRRRLLGQRDWKIRGLAAAVAILAASVAWMIFGTNWSTPQVVEIPRQPKILPDTDPPRRVQLETGFTRLTLDGNVQVLIQGPAEYSIASANLIRLNFGKLTAIVPHSVAGFSVMTKDASVTDLGTEFAVEAGEHYTKAEVFEGRVSVEPTTGGNPVKQILSAGQANRVYGGQVIPEDPSPKMYVRVGDYDIRHAAETRDSAALARWTEFSHKLRRDPSLLAYYTFDNESESPWKLLNRATATADQYDGQIFNATWDKGHLPGRHALAFNGKNSYVRVNIPGRLNQLTIAMWLRVDAWDHRRIGLFMSDDWNVPGEIHWEIDPDRHHIFGSYRSQSRDFTLISASPVEPNAQWIHLVGTFDVPDEKIVLYRDGVREIAGIVPGAVPMSIDSARIGSWDHKTAPEPDGLVNRTLNGRIDELAIFNRVLSETEIQAMYQAEKGDE